MFENPKKHRVSLDFGRSTCSIISSRWISALCASLVAPARSTCRAELTAAAWPRGVARSMASEERCRKPPRSGVVTGNESVLVGHRCGHDPSEPPQMWKNQRKSMCMVMIHPEKSRSSGSFWARQIR